jgi:hypothetical protein
MITLRPRAGTISFRLLKSTLHCINLCRHNKDTNFADAVGYLRSLDHKDRTEVYGRTIAWLADNASYDTFITFRKQVWSAGFFTSQVKSEGASDIE